MKTNIKYPPAMAKAIQDVLKASAKWRATDEIDRANKNKVLAENNFVICVERESSDARNGDRITDYKIDFLMSDADFEKYCQLVYAENLKAGLDSGGVGSTFWPLKKAVIDAEDKLIDTVASQFPTKFTPDIVKLTKTHYKYRKEFLRITLGDSYIL